MFEGLALESHSHTSISLFQLFSEEFCLARFDSPEVSRKFTPP